MIEPTELDADWISDALADLIPESLDDRVWIQEEPQEVEGRLVNRFRGRTSNLVVLVSVAPLHLKGSDEKKVSYQVTIFKEKDGKVKRPNTADINRVRSAFFMRDLAPNERSYEGTVGDSKAHHIFAVIDEKLIIIP
jgi:hypothetical protein